MPYKTSLELRVTQRYVGTYQHLDQWETLAIAKVLGTRKVFDPEQVTRRWYKARGLSKAEIRHQMARYYQDASEGQTVVFYVVVKHKPGQRDDIMQAIHDSFSRRGCAHEWDCCGCASYSATATHYRGNEFKVEVTTSYNF